VSLARSWHLPSRQRQSATADWRFTSDGDVTPEADEHTASISDGVERRESRAIRA